MRKRTYWLCVAWYYVKMLLECALWVLGIYAFVILFLLLM